MITYDLEVASGDVVCLLSRQGWECISAMDSDSELGWGSIDCGQCDRVAL